MVDIHSNTSMGDVKLHKCSDCSYSSTRSGNVKKHMMLIHKKKRLTRKYCKKEPDQKILQYESIENTDPPLLKTPENFFIKADNKCIMQGIENERRYFIATKSKPAKQNIQQKEKEYYFYAGLYMGIILAALHGNITQRNELLTKHIG
jgi:hypothetical protein